MGDKIFEQIQILHLRDLFFQPDRYQSPIYSVYYMNRCLADLSDRHYALFANNQHPYQLHLYEAYNKFLRNQHDPVHQAEEEWIQNRIAKIKEDRESLLNTEEGEMLSVDEL